MGLRACAPPLARVALLAEGVDRNVYSIESCWNDKLVALLAEGVDRNIGQAPEDYKAYRSPSSRRAWIEIRQTRTELARLQVALLAEGVDRNWSERSMRKQNAMSPSSRRAWIEILLLQHRKNPTGSPSSRRAWIEISSSGGWSSGSGVALLAEGVDRNVPNAYYSESGSRSPSSRRAWIEIAEALASREWQESRPPRGGRG